MSRRASATSNTVGVPDFGRGALMFAVGSCSSILSVTAWRIAVRNIGNTFDSGPEHYATLAGWCCP